MTVPGELFAYFLVEDPSVEALPLPIVSSDRVAVVRGAAPNELTYYASALDFVGGTYEFQQETPSTGDTVIINDNVGRLYVSTGSLVLADLTVQLPADVVDGERRVEICFSAAVTRLTVRNAAAATVPTAPTSGFGPGAAIEFLFIDAMTGWIYWK